MELHRGLVRAYEPTTHTAAVLLVGSLSRTLLSVPVAQHIAAHLVIEGAACGVAFFADGSHAVVLAIIDGPPVPPLILDAIGPTLTLDHVLNGWHDDFLGDLIKDQYTAASSGTAAAGALQNNAHGGVYRLSSGTSTGANHVLYLGNSADAYATLDTDPGWITATLMTVSRTTNAACITGARDAAFNNAVDIGISTTDVATNWCLRTRTGGGALTALNTGTPADTNPHSHVLHVRPVAGTLTADYWLDATKIGTTTTNVPSNVLTPYMSAYLPAAAAACYSDVNAWHIMPNHSP